MLGCAVVFMGLGHLLPEARGIVAAAARSLGMDQTTDTHGAERIAELLVLFAAAVACVRAKFSIALRAIFAVASSN